MCSFEKVRDGVWLLRTPFSTVWTGIVLIRGEENYLIDSGADDPEVYLIPALAELGLGIGDISWLLNTHCHGDHISGHAALVERYGLRVATFEGGAAQLADPASNAVRIRTRFPDFSPPPQSWLKGVRADRTLSHGEILGGRLRLIHTPGHDRDCVAWYDIPTRTVITGDSLQANGTPTQGIGFYSSLPDYRLTLDRLDEEEIECILCGHDYDGIGDVVTGRDRVREALRFCRDRVALYGERIAACVARGETAADAIARRLIREVGCGMPNHLFLALYTVTEHLREMSVAAETENP